MHEGWRPRRRELKHFCDAVKSPQYACLEDVEQAHLVSSIETIALMNQKLCTLPQLDVPYKEEDAEMILRRLDLPTAHG